MRTCASTACNNAAARPRWPHMAYSLLKVTPCIQPWPTPFLVPDYSEGSVVSWNTTEVSCNFFWRDSWDWNPIWFSFRGQNHDTGITEPCAAALVGWAGIRRFSRIRQVQCFRKGTVGSTPWQLARARSNAARGTSKFEKTQPRLKIAQLKWIR